MANTTKEDQKENKESQEILRRSKSEPMLNMAGNTSVFYNKGGKLVKHMTSLRRTQSEPVFKRNSLEQEEETYVKQPIMTVFENADPTTLSANKHADISDHAETAELHLEKFPDQVIRKGNPNILLVQDDDNSDNQDDSNTKSHDEPMAIQEDFQIWEEDEREKEYNMGPYPQYKAGQRREYHRDQRNHNKTIEEIQHIMCCIVKIHPSQVDLRPDKDKLMSMKTFGKTKNLWFWMKFKNPKCESEKWKYLRYRVYIFVDYDNIHDPVNEILQRLNLDKVPKTVLTVSQNLSNNKKPDDDVCAKLLQQKDGNFYKIYYIQADDTDQATDKELVRQIEAVRKASKAEIYIISGDRERYESLHDEHNKIFFLDMNTTSVDDVIARLERRGKI